MATKKLDTKDLITLVNKVPDDKLRNQLLEEVAKIEESTNVFFKEAELDKIPEMA